MTIRCNADAVEVFLPTTIRCNADAVEVFLPTTVYCVACSEKASATISAAVAPAVVAAAMSQEEHSLCQTDVGRSYADQIRTGSAGGRPIVSSATSAPGSARGTDSISDGGTQSGSRATGYGGRPTVGTSSQSDHFSAAASGGGTAAVHAVDAHSVSFCGFLVGTKRIRLADHLPLRFAPSAPISPGMYLGEDVITLWASLRSQAPGTSAEAMRRVLGAMYRTNLDPAAPDPVLHPAPVFITAYEERHHNTTMKLLLSGVRPVDSPADGLHDGLPRVSAGIDGNFKLFCFKTKATGEDRGTFHANSMHLPDALVARHASSLQLETASAKKKAAAASASAAARAAALTAPSASAAAAAPAPTSAAAPASSSAAAAVAAAPASSSVAAVPASSSGAAAPSSLPDAAAPAAPALQHDVDECGSDLRAARHVTGSRKHDSLRYSGVAAMIGRNGNLINFLNMSDGEKWHYASALFHHSDGSPPLVLFYDIVCRWYKWAVERMKVAVAGGTDRDVSMPTCSCCDPATGAVKPSTAAALYTTDPVLNWMHSYAHGVGCQLSFAAFLHLAARIGNTTGEETEQFWALMRLCANATKHMGPGRNLDYHMEYIISHNVHKQVHSMDLLYRRVLSATARIRQREKRLDATLASAGAIMGLTPEVITQRAPEWMSEFLTPPSSENLVDSIPIGVRKDIQSYLSLQAMQSFITGWNPSLQAVTESIPGVDPSIVFGSLAPEVRDYCVWCAHAHRSAPNEGAFVVRGNMLSPPHVPGHPSAPPSLHLPPPPLTRRTTPLTTGPPHLTNCAPPCRLPIAVCAGARAFREAIQAVFPEPFATPTDCQASTIPEPEGVQ